MCRFNERHITSARLHSATRRCRIQFRPNKANRSTQRKTPLKTPLRSTIPSFSLRLFRSDVGVAYGGPVGCRTRVQQRKPKLHTCVTCSLGKGNPARTSKFMCGGYPLHPSCAEHDSGFSKGILRGVHGSRARGGSYARFSLSPNLSVRNHR